MFDPLTPAFLPPLIETAHHGFSHFLELAALTPEDTDIMAQVQKWFTNFVKSGQAWALGIGIVVGYMFRSFTAY